MSNEENAELEIIASVNKSADLTDETEKAIIAAIAADKNDADEALEILTDDSNNPPSSP